MNENPGQLVPSGTPLKKTSGAISVLNGSILTKGNMSYILH